MLSRLYSALVLASLALCSLPAGAAEDRPPNVIVVLADNLGAGDLGCYGSKLHRTPNLDRMAAEGVKFTSFYVTSGVCTPSRASLVTGCYSQRVNLHVSDLGGAVLQPVAAKGLNPDEVTVAEVLKPRGYATACYGKWHLGDQLPFLPTNQGFDEFLGVPYSEDMVQEKKPDLWPPLPLMRGTMVIEAPVDCEKLTRIYTEAAVDFVRRNTERPFFLYMPAARPGSTQVVHVGNEFRGKSANGLYGDSVEELDRSLGVVLDAVKKQGLDDRTLVIWTSDNGAVRRNPPQGSNAPFAGWGYGTSEGGMRMPCLMRWPGHIPAGSVCDEVTTTLDVLPTLAAMAGASVGSDHKLDGYDASDLWLGKAGARSHYDESGFFFYHMAQLQAVRRGPWKLYLPLDSALALGAKKAPPQALRLFDVRHDIGEEHEVSAEHPEEVKALLALARRARADLGDLNAPGEGQRAAGHVDHPTARVKE